MNYRIIPVTAFQQNCTLVWCDKTHEAALIDPGGDMDKLINEVTKEGVTVTKILLTHGHLDHVGAACRLSKHYQVPIIGPEKSDDFWLQSLPQQSQMFGLPDEGVLVPTQWLQDGDVVMVGEETFDVIHCPGHTPGHVVFYNAAARWAQVGDVLFNGGIGRSDFPQGDHGDLIRSICEKLLPLGDNIDFVPGHGPMSTFGRERISNPFLQ